MTNPYDVDVLLHRLTEHATVTLHALWAGIMLVDDDGELRFVAASEERVIEAEVFQERVEEGACFDAYSKSEVIAVPDIEADPRWPSYTERLTEHGLRAVLGIPMTALGKTIGVINIYREQPGPWERDDVGAGEILTAMGAAYVLHANHLRTHQSLVSHLQSAIESRDVIGQAKGILMARAGVDADAAFSMLRERSQATNRKLRDAAAEVTGYAARAERRSGGPSQD